MVNKQTSKQATRIIKMKLVSITVGCSHDGRRELNDLESGFYHVGGSSQISISKKQKFLSEAEYFIVYWGKSKKCVYHEKRGKFIGIYKNGGYFRINNSKEYRLLTCNNNNQIFNSVDYEKRCQSIDREEWYPIGVYLKQLYDGELELPRNVSIRGNFNNIKNEENIKYIETLIGNIEKKLVTPKEPDYPPHPLFQGLEIEGLP